LGLLGVRYDDHLRLIGKRVVDFLFVIIELFSIGGTAEALRAIIGSKSAISLQRDLVVPKFRVEEVPSTNHSFSQKTRLNDLSYTRYKNLNRFFFRFVTIHAFDKQTDRQTDGKNSHRYRPRGKNHKGNCDM